MKTLIVFSHLRWNFVYQRPQHVMSRLARRWRVIFIEEPLPQAAQPRIERIQPAAGVEVWRPYVGGDASGFHDDHLPVLQRLIARAIAEQGIRDYWLWFYTPMAIPLAAGLASRGVVYDCMDELAAFKNAPRQVMQRENALFRMADVVFTGGRSLYYAKRGRHPNVYCFPSSVDARHFRAVAEDHPLQAGIAHPRLGYCGVIDERIDMPLVAALAQARPHWQLVMVGPTAKIDPSALPRQPNIHWLGQQSYDDLPAFISGWDVCLLPFALNEATRYISPTKTVEYMACGRPSVSTPITDVMEPYGHVVPIAANAGDFLAACDAILQRSPPEQAAHARALAEIVARTSWDATANQMGELIMKADQARWAGVASQPAAESLDAASLELEDASDAVSVVELPARRASAA